MRDYSYYLTNIGEIGTVKRVKPPLVTVDGLPHARIREIVIFSNGQLGQIFSIAQDTIEIVLFSRKHVKVGAEVVRTNEFPTIPVCDMLFGRTISPLGQNLATGEFIQSEENRHIEIEPLGIGDRAQIKRFFSSGIAIVDMMVPLGHGQKELIIGDRKTGKSSFVQTAMKQQAVEGTVIIYAAIGKKNSEIKAIEETIEKQIGKFKAILLASTSSDSPGLIYLTPFAAMTVAEYFRDQGRDVLLLLDDLSTHAKYYREIALLAKNFPGRESYPGDIFYTHARLLERAGNFIHQQKGNVAITCFPLTETVEGNFTSFISTNLMGITDGHIFFDSELFYKGRRPGINIGLSVSRVGRQTQSKVARSITREITSFLTLYEKLQNLSHFGSELTQSVKEILVKGEKLYVFFDQQSSLVIPEHIQYVIFSLIWLNDETIQSLGIETVRAKLLTAYQKEENRTFLKDLFAVDTFNGLLDKIHQNKERIYALWQTT